MEGTVVLDAPLSPGVPRNCRHSVAGAAFWPCAPTGSAAAVTSQMITSHRDTETQRIFLADCLCVSVSLWPVIISRP